MVGNRGRRVALAACVLAAAFADGVFADSPAVVGDTAAGAAISEKPISENPDDGAGIEALVRQLGSDDYWTRTSAAAELRGIGPAASDALLAAAESSDDLEVALAARWLIDEMPLASPADPAEVAELLERYRQAGPADSLSVMRQLVRIDDDAGIEALARIVRLDRSTAAAAAAAAILAAEWRPGDRRFALIAGRVKAGIGTSKRPAAAFLRAVVEFAEGDAEAVDEAAAAIARLREAAPATTDRKGAGLMMLEDPVIGLAIPPQAVLDRAFVAMLVAAGRGELAMAESRRLLDAAVEEQEDIIRGYRIAAVLAWSADLGVPQLVDHVIEKADSETTKRGAQTVSSQPIAAYAAAVALKAAGAADRSEKLAAEALRTTAEETRLHLDAASKLTHWGATDWAMREYESLTAGKDDADEEFIATAIMFSEQLHDLGRHADAAACLRRMLEPPEEPGRPNRRANAEALLRQAGRDPRSTRSRMLFFDALAAASRGDREAHDTLLARAVDEPGTDVDALIAAYHASAGSPQRREELRGKIRESLEVLEAEIVANPEEANALNEYAWLAANTEGDADRAIRHSKKSLTLSFDNPSYLDTLAHGHAAAGRIDRAIRTQEVAARLEPHNRTIRRNLERFRGMATPSSGRP